MITPSRPSVQWTLARVGWLSLLVLPLSAVVFGCGAAFALGADTPRFLLEPLFWLTVPLPILLGQVLLLSGAPQWRPGRQRDRGPIFLSAVGLGLGAAGLSAAIFLAGLSLVQLWTLDAGMKNAVSSEYAVLLLGGFWAPWTLIFFVVVRDPWSARFGRLYRMLIAGTVLEFACTIPVDVFVRRRASCYCEQGTALSLLLGLSTAGLLFGPGVVLLSLRRRNQWHLRNEVCLGCGYDLRHLPEPRCPECGRPFKPQSAPVEQSA